MKAKLVPYEKYKDSGGEFLGKLPIDWRFSKLKFLTSKVGSGKTPSGGAEVYTQNGIQFLRSQNVHDDGLRLDDVVFISEQIDQELTNSRVEALDILLNITGASIGRTCVVPPGLGRANVNQHVCIIRLRDLGLVGFVSYFLRSPDTKSLIANAQDGAAREGLTFQTVSSFALPLPPPQEQQRIVVYLDTETQRIDNLIKEQEELIELLREKRLALISHAVTKGLDPNAKMKDSGVEWIGEIPDGWGVPCIGYHYTVQLGKMLDTSQITGESLAPYLRNTDVQWGRINLEDLPMMDFSKADRDRYQLRSGDLLVCEGGDIGRCAVWEEQDSDFFYQKALHRIRAVDPAMDSTRFLLYFFEYASKNGIFSIGVEKATIIHLTAERVRAHRFVRPLIAEQKAIASFLDTQTARIDALVAEAESTIDLMQEHRSSLVSAVVTGKVRVPA